ncbi:N-acyl homoserine lactonase family protein [Aliikangiella sp. IMCC44359]|uniref:N-acyl homoserine lactonase family protein n=1 Tax=Aliikangiella sp. IMCC44359 TaxID=3459125 RepID=UPI00403ADA31
MKKLKLTVTAIILITLINCADKRLDNEIRLYTLDCGTYHVSDMASFSVKGKYNGEKTTLSNPCFLIRHPKGDLIWDTGLNESLVNKTEGIKNGVWHSMMKTKLTEQLAILKLKPEDIEYLSLSHIHPDHSGNANLFVNSKFIINEQERRYMFSKDISAMFGDSYNKLENVSTLVFKKQHDVYNDGSVVIQSMPGHTPGSSVLLIRLENSGNLLLTGDLYIHQRGREEQTLFQYNVDQQTIAESRKRFEILAKQENARVIIQHEQKDFRALPLFPEFLN